MTNTQCLACGKDKIVETSDFCVDCIIILANYIKANRYLLEATKKSFGRIQLDDNKHLSPNNLWKRSEDIRKGARGELT